MGISNRAGIYAKLICSWQVAPSVWKKYSISIISWSTFYYLAYKVELFHALTIYSPVISEEENSTVRYKQSLLMGMWLSFSTFFSRQTYFNPRLIGLNARIPLSNFYEDSNHVSLFFWFQMVFGPRNSTINCFKATLSKSNTLQ